MDIVKLLKSDMGVAAAKPWHTDTPLWDVQMHFTIDLETEKGQKLKKFFEEFGICFQK